MPKSSKRRPSKSHRQTTSSDKPNAKRQGEICRWMFDALKGAQPQVRVRRYLLEEVDEIAAKVVAGERLSDRGGMSNWGLIFNGLKFNGQGKQSCGKPMLEFVGYLGEALQREGSLTLPPILALELMIDLEIEPRRLKLGERGHRWWIENTDFGGKELGYHFRLPLLEPPPITLFGSPEEAFRDLQVRADRYT